LPRLKHRMSRSSTPPRDLRLILTLLEPEKLERLSSLSHPCSQLLRNAVPCSAVPPHYSATHFRANHRWSGCTKATSSSTSRSSASSPNRRPLLRADRKPPRAATSSAKSTSPWIASSSQPLTPPTPLQAPAKCHVPRRPLQRRPRLHLGPAAGDSPSPVHRCRGEPPTASPILLQPHK
jgi:hypothetical protein